MRSLGPWGTSFSLSEGRGDVVDRTGRRLAQLDGDGGWVLGAPDRRLSFAPAAAAHPLFGACLILDGGEGAATEMAAVHWAAPQAIPPIFQPTALPPLSGTMLLNLLAACARAAGVTRLRYRGPYPTSALWTSLAQAFATDGSENDFTAGAAELLLAPRMHEVAVDFSPDPFERWWPSPRVAVQARRDIERVFVDGQAFTRSASAVRRLRLLDERDQLTAELWFGDAPWAQVATLTPRGELVAGPHPPPALDDAIVGQELPLALRRALGELVAETAPPLLAPLVPRLFERARLRWGDAGMAAVRDDEGGATVHAALWLTLRAHGAARVALGLAEALAPWALVAATRGQK